MNTYLAKKFISIDRDFIWHPYTQMKDFEHEDPLFVERGEGVFLYDVYGKAYYDTISSWWCIVHGHNHPHIKEAITRQINILDQVHFAGTTHEPAIKVAELLRHFVPKRLSRIFFSDNGSTAVEVALKMAVQYWHHAGFNEKNTFVSLEHGYHGDTIGAMSLGGVPQFKGPFDALTFDSIRLPAPYCYRCPMGQEKGACDIDCLNPFEDILKEKRDQIAGIILEPLLMGAGGMLVYPETYLKRLEALIKDKDIFLIFDEVATGFARTGEMFAFMKAGVIPDFLCISKGLTGGILPLGATLTTEDVFNSFYADYAEGKTFYHGHTFTANPLSTAAARASLELFKLNPIVESVKAKELILQNSVKAFTDFPFVGDIRGIGMVWAFELVKDKETKTPFQSEFRAGWKVYQEGLKHGLILRPLGDVTYLFLPQSITNRQIEDCLQRLWTTFEACKKTFSS